MKTVGIDIGRTQLRVAILDEEYNVLDVFKTNNDRALTVEQNVDKLIAFIQKQESPLKGVGIGCPGPLNLRTGTILNPPNLVGWDNFGLVKYIESKTGLRTVLNNDANVAGLAEALLGGGMGYESVCYMGLSTGLGGAIIYQGHLINGANGNAGEFWNMMVNEDPHCHKNANPGSLNEQISGSGLEVLAAEAYGKPVSPKELFEKFYEKDPTAVRIVEQATEALARGIANVACSIDPDVFVFGGSIAIFNPAYVDMAAERAKKYLLAPNALHIEKARFGDDAGLVGAALLV